MAADNHDDGNAELYETLGHPTRILILRALSEKPASFSELKRATGIDSSGNLTFHLNKLGSLIRTTPDGNYALTDEGRDAIRVVTATEQVISHNKEMPRAREKISWSRAAVSIAIMLLLIGGTFLAMEGRAVSSKEQFSNLEEGWGGFVVGPGQRRAVSGGTFCGGASCYGTNTLFMSYFLAPGNVSEFLPPGLTLNLETDGNATIMSVPVTSYVTNFYFTRPPDFQGMMPFLVNPSSQSLNVTTSVFEIDIVSYPNQSQGQQLFYGGIVLVAIDLAFGVWYIALRARRASTRL